MPAVGIDFGTTKTLVVCWDQERSCARPVRLGRGRDDLPTSLHLDTHGEWAFADDADDLRETDPAGYLPRLKRALGRRKQVILRQKSIDSVDLTAGYLKHVKRRVEMETFQGVRITSAVLTVPALFGEAARDGLTEAAGKAELKEVQLLEEPLAAGMAFLQEKTGTPLGECVLVFDWGGGTLDLALLHQRNGHFVISPELMGGDDMCGGEDIDDLFRTEVAARLQSLGVGNEELQSPRLQFAIVRQAKEAKHHLSQKEVADIRLVADGKAVHLPWKREEFEALAAPMVERAVATLQQLVIKCQASGQQPGYVLLVGGSSRIPLVANMIKDQVGLAPVLWDYSIEAVAIGAAIKANGGVIAAKPTPPPPRAPTVSDEERAARKARAAVARLKEVLDRPGATDATRRQSVTSEMIGVCKTLAEAGNAEAQGLVGMCYSCGYGVAPDYAEACRWYRKAAEQGSATAQYCLGMCYANGTGVARDDTEAVNWYRRAAAWGDSRAQFVLGLYHLQGFVVEMDRREGMEWLGKAAAQGNTEASKLLQQLKIVAGNSDEVKLAAQAVEELKEVLDRPGATDATRRQSVTSEMIGVCKTLAEAGNAEARYLFGRCCLCGYGVARDYAEACKWYRKAAWSGNAEAQHNLGLCHQGGFGVAKDDVAAVAWFRKAAEQGYAPAQSSLGCCYLRGAGIAQDQHEAEGWLRKAADQGESTAHEELAALARAQAHASRPKQTVGHDTSPPVPPATTAAPDRGSPTDPVPPGAKPGPKPSGCLKGFLILAGLAGVLSLFLRQSREQPAVSSPVDNSSGGRGVETQASPESRDAPMGGAPTVPSQVADSSQRTVEELRERATKGNAEAQFQLGCCYASGNGVAKDEVEAVAWFRRAADSGFAQAQFQLGACYALGNGVPAKDPASAARLFRKAAEQGDANGQAQLGDCYAEGIGVAQDYAEAVKWFRKAADQGDAYAQCSLGVCYENGTGVPKDETEAVRWYRAARDYAPAQYRLGVCYRKGTGVPQDGTEAVKWYQKAADQGDASAQYELGLCYENGTGVPKDKAEAAKWLRRAAEQGRTEARDALDGLEHSRPPGKWWQVWRR
jgi:TPR repeat protein/actin-like ATPase involved in cell morphogenesis